MMLPGRVSYSEDENRMGCCGVGTASDWGQGVGSGPPAEGGKAAGDGAAGEL